MKGEEAEVVRVDGERKQSRDRDADVVQRSNAGAARDAIELPRAERADDREQGRKRRAPREHDEQREGGGDDGEEDAERELGHRRGRGRPRQTSMISASLALIISSIFAM